MSLIRRALVLSAVVVVALGASFMLESTTAASSAPRPVQAAQPAPGPASPGLCFATQKCVPANHPGTSGTIAPALTFGFIGAAAVVLIDRRRRRRGPVVRPTPFGFFPAIDRPPIAN